ncbi:MAG: redox-sensing transcriptional repressor Rex [Muribaculaceae bacterium]|nr:redox-sensing transcriptional repressor Rex [Muribaculaceae bacterium]
MNYGERHIDRAMIPEPTLRRLPWYLAYLKMLDLKHEEHVSSTQIAKRLNVDASQIAKDLSFLNIKGKTRIGYEVHPLTKVLTEFLGFKYRHNAYLIGAGSLGSALMRDLGLMQFGLNIVAAFDIDPEIIGSVVSDIPIYDFAELPSRQRSSGVAIAIVAVPFSSAQEVADVLVDSNIKAIWNFTPFRIKVPRNVVLQNTSIYSDLALMYNSIEANVNNKNITK